MLGSVKIKLGLVVVGLLVLVIFGWWLYPNNKNGGGIFTEPGTTGEFFPGGEERLVEEPSNNQNTTASSSPLVSERLQQVAIRPVAGAALWSMGDSETVLFMERATGHLYRFNPHTAPVRLSQTTIPKVYGLRAASHNPETLDIFLTYLKDSQPQHFWGQLKVATSSITGDDFLATGEGLPSLEGEVLSDRVLDWSLAPNQQAVFVLERAGNQIRGSVVKLKDRATEQVFASRFFDWQPNWQGTTTIDLQTKPSAKTNGFLYEFDINKKTLEPVVGGVPGLLTRRHPNQNKIVYSGNLGAEVVFGLFDPNQAIFHRLPIKTLADKCTFNYDGSYLYCGVPTELPPGAYPDDWYSGQISFTDNIWRINPNTYQSELIFSPSLANLPINLDITSLFLSRDGQQLYFINKNDALLWVLDLTSGFVE